jgi:hypothetical protein
MGQYAYKNDLVTPWRKTLSEQLVFDLAFVPAGPLLALAKKDPGRLEPPDAFPEECAPSLSGPL